MPMPAAKAKPTRRAKTAANGDKAMRYLPVSKGFQPYAERAEVVAKDRRKAKGLMAAADEKVEKTRNARGAFAKVRKDLASLMRLVRAWLTGAYRVAPWNTVVLALAALLYFVSPLDFVPDWLPGLGLADDAAVIGMVVAAIKKDLSDFLKWEKTEGKSPARRAPRARASAA